MNVFVSYQEPFSKTGFRLELAPKNALLYYKSMISWPRLRNNIHKEKDNNHRDSLFDLPLYPPCPEENSSDSAISDASKKLTADTNQRIASFSVERAKKQLTEINEIFFAKNH